MKNADYQTRTFTAQWAGVKTYGCWHLPDSPIGVCCLVHGFGEHSGRYDDSVIPWLISRGWAVLCFDLVGHGRSAGKRGHCRGYSQLMEQLTAAYSMARKDHPNLPLMLYGHSMGGNLVLNFVIRGLGKPDLLIASSPYLRLAFSPPAWKWWAGKLLWKIWPSITMPSGLDPKAISSQPEEVKAYLADPLVHDLVSPNYSFPVIEAGEWALENASRYNLPTFLAHGTSDRIIDPAGSETFYQESTRAELLLLEGGFHELHHDKVRSDYFSALGDWLDRWKAPL